MCVSPNRRPPILRELLRLDSTTLEGRPRDISGLEESVGTSNSPGASHLSDEAVRSMETKLKDVDLHLKERWANARKDTERPVEEVERKKTSVFDRGGGGGHRY